MKVIVCGAGQVGYTIARYLSGDKADITLIDIDEELIATATDTLDVRGIVGFASHPAVLAKAGAETADMLIAVTHTDEVNMVACQVAHSLFSVPTRIARVRNKTYLEPRWGDLFSRDHLPVDLIISPETEVAESISRRLSVPGAFEVMHFADEKLHLVGVRCTVETPIVDTMLNQISELFPNLKMMIVAIMRDGELIVPTGEDQLMLGDEAYIAVSSDNLERTMKVFGHTETEGRRVLVVGGGNIGRELAGIIEKNHPSVVLKLIELDKNAAMKAAEVLDKALVLHGDALDSAVLEDANVAKTETVIAVTNDDEANILVSLLAKKHGAQRAITLVNKSSYGTLIGQLGIETIVNPRAITVSSILQYVRQGRVRAVRSLGQGVGEVIEIEAMDTSNIVGKPIADLKLPKGIKIGGILRGDEVIDLREAGAIKARDRVVMFVAEGCSRQAEKLFAVSMGFF